LHIAGIQGLSLIDFPGRIASVIFLAHCDFRCPFCQNPDLVNPPADAPSFTADETLARLYERRKLIDGVVVTGGEPLLQPDTPDFLVRLGDETGVPVKLDTNGHHPDRLRQVLERKAAAYVAMDLKTSLSRYSEAANRLVNVNHLEESIRLIRESGVDYEFRTTVAPGLVDEAAIDEMGRLIQGARRWAFQQYQGHGVLDPEFGRRRPLAPEKIRALALRAEPFVKEVVLRGV